MIPADISPTQYTNLEVGPAAAADEEGIPGEGDPLLVDDEGGAAVGVAGGGADLDLVGTELDFVAGLEKEVGLQTKSEAEVGQQREFIYWPSILRRDLA